MVAVDTKAFSMMAWHEKGRWGCWLRLFGPGVYVSNSPPLFSERYGYDKCFRVFGVLFKWLPKVRELVVIVSASQLDELRNDKEHYRELPGNEAWLGDAPFGGYDNYESANGKRFRIEMSNK